MSAHASSLPPIVVMGVQGSGKSTIAALIAERIGGSFVDGDRLHSAENVAKMATGIPLTDADREPWLHTIGAVLADGRERGIVVVCSSLRRAYRDLLRGDAPGTVFVHLHGAFELIASRVNARAHEFMPPALLQSQFDALEHLTGDESGVLLDVADSPEEIADAAVAFVRAHRSDVSD